MADEKMGELRQALDDAVLTHTGRSIGDLASQHVLDDIMPYIAALQPTQPAQPDEPRAIIQHFALAMERKLAANEHKPGWKQDSPFDLLRRLREEVVELVDAVNDLTHVHMGQSPRTVQETTAAILLEAVDVANFALFVADVCGALPPTDERGR